MRAIEKTGDRMRIGRRLEGRPIQRGEGAGPDRQVECESRRGCVRDQRRRADDHRRRGALNIGIGRRPARAAAAQSRGDRDGDSAPAGTGRRGRRDPGRAVHRERGRIKGAEFDGRRPGEVGPGDDDAFAALGRPATRRQAGDGRRGRRRGAGHTGLQRRARPVAPAINDIGGEIGRHDIVAAQREFGVDRRVFLEQDIVLVVAEFAIKGEACARIPIIGGVGAARRRRRIGNPVPRLHRQRGLIDLIEVA
ncbi:hypothetical protein D3C72_922930 [compost metagenome]